METRVLCVTATEAEANAIRRIATMTSENEFIVGGHRLSVLVAGIGSVPTAWNLCRWISSNGRPDIAVNSGIAGSFRNSFDTGSVVVSAEDRFGDQGIDDNGRFLTLAEAGLVNSGDFPYVGGVLPADQAMLKKMGEFSHVKAVTVNTASGSEAAIKRIVEKFNPDIETMEGAAFFYICRCESIPFFSIRAISNLIEPRKRENWNVRLALDNLSASLEDVFLKL